MTNEDSDLTERFISAATSIQQHYLQAELNEAVKAGEGLMGFLGATSGSYAQLMEIGINLALRYPAEARQIISGIEWARTECNHPKDEFCIPKNLLEDFINIVLHDIYPEEKPRED